MEIQLVQGDTSKIYKFQRKNVNGEVIKTLPQKMWITFKKVSDIDDCLFQKTLEDGITYNDEDNYYRFQIQPDETCNLDYKTYGFDIAILNEAGDKKTLLNDGKLKIIKHYTKKENEV